MLDMFVVSLTVALVQLGVVANVAPGEGATYFAAVVILTIFAAESFDPRLIWDAMEEKK
jgi:paraquat-inducible protein A